MDIEATSSDQLVREMHRRVSYHCIVLERNSVLQVENRLPFPEKINNEYLLEDGIGVRPEGIVLVLDACIATIKIFDILGTAHPTN